MYLLVIVIGIVIATVMAVARLLVDHPMLGRAPYTLGLDPLGLVLLDAVRNLFSLSFSY